MFEENKEFPTNVFQIIKKYEKLFQLRRNYLIYHQSCVKRYKLPLKLLTLGQCSMTNSYFKD